VSSDWKIENALEKDLAPDIYVVRVVFPNGEQLEDIINLKSGETKIVRLRETLRSGSVDNNHTDDFRIIGSSISNSQETYEVFPNKAGSIFYDQYSSGRATAVLWSYEEGEEKIQSVPEFKHLLMDPHGQTIKLNLKNGFVSRFEIKERSGDSLFVLLPPVGRLSLRIKTMASLIEIENEFDISVDLPNVRANALLELLNRGEINRAKSLMQNFDIAENLLNNKMIDPTSAAVGAYYLLKTRELHRLHNWVSNLAVRFKWLADGPIIYAWQMLLEDPENCSSEIREQLLKSCDRGYPIFTEGLRLLYEGLVRCSFFFGKDDLKVAEALNETKKILESADLSKEITTYRVKNPNGSASNLSDRIFLY
jgi:hypothetical protein